MTDFITYDIVRIKLLEFVVKSSNLNELQIDHFVQIIYSTSFKTHYYKLFKQGKNKNEIIEEMKYYAFNILLPKEQLN